MHMYVRIMQNMLLVIGEILSNKWPKFVRFLSLQAYQFQHARDLRLVCNGYYPEIHVMDAFTFDILFSLQSKVSPDWISACCILRPVKREGLFERNPVHYIFICFFYPTRNFGGCLIVVEMNNRFFFHPFDNFTADFESFSLQRWNFKFWSLFKLLNCLKNSPPP